MGVIGENAIKMCLFLSGHLQLVLEYYSLSIFSALVC